jgi:IS1 family transposase
MAHAGDALGLHEAVVQRAKELFAGFRDDREMVQQFKGVIAACLAEAFDQLSKDGKQLLKKIAGESSSLGEESNNNGVTHARASRRNDLHSASLAGKGGLLLDTTVVSHGGVGGTTSLEEKKLSLLTGQAFETKSAATWDIDDCKCWMIEATKSIAKSWFEARQSSTALLNDESKAIPKATIDELEGCLIEHTLKICEYLELELKHKSDGKAKSTTAGGLHVNTPRVGDMGNIGIKWQHSYERGSGGKGGVGNSGRTISGVKPGERSSRTAGQILLLLTAKKFSNIINDQVAGTAFHKELKGVIGREDAKQRLERRDEATKARLKQMNRKPWLQARVQL